MKTYSCPQMIVDDAQPSNIIAVSIISGESANQDIPVQVKEDNTFSKDWCDLFADENRD